MPVELDIFSGRENPRWVLDPTGSDRLRDLHRRLRLGQPATDEPPGLGYRGFLYELEGQRWRAWKGIVTGPGAAVLSDPASMIERALLASLPSEWWDLNPRVLKAIGRERP